MSTSSRSNASVASAQPGRRLAALDGLRLVAALAVVLHHFVGVDLDYWGRPNQVEFPDLSALAKYGYLGVPLFFVISGFVILMTAYDRSVESFAASRISRLFPAYWVAILLTFVLQQFWTEGRTPDPMTALLNLTMVQEAFDVANVQGAFWTLWYELKFYLLIGVFIVVGMTRQRVLAFTFLWPLLAILARATDSDLLSSLLMPSYAPYFAAGMCLYIVHREGHDLLAWLLLTFNFVLCLRQAVAYSERASELTAQTISPLVVAGLVTGMFLLVLACSHGWLSRIQWRWLTVAGVITYPLYLLHGQFGFAMIDVLSDRLDSRAVLVIVVAVCVLMAYLVHRLVERPLSPLMRRAISGALSRPGPPSGPPARPDPAGAAPSR